MPPVKKKKHTVSSADTPDHAAAIIANNTAAILANNENLLIIQQQRQQIDEKDDYIRQLNDAAILKDARIETLEAENEQLRIAINANNINNNNMIDKETSLIIFSEGMKVLGAEVVSIVTDNQNLPVPFHVPSDVRNCRCGICGERRPRTCCNSCGKFFCIIGSVAPEIINEGKEDEAITYKHNKVYTKKEINLNPTSDARPNCYYVHLALMCNNFNNLENIFSAMNSSLVFNQQWDIYNNDDDDAEDSSYNGNDSSNESDSSN